MHLSSPVFEHGGLLPKRYTCDGKGIPPPLIVSGVPDNARSLVLIVDDPDAVGGLFTHWIVWNMPRDTFYIARLEGEPPLPIESVEGLTSFGKRGYGAPCPPSGIHRYFFRLFALDKKLELRDGVERSDVERAMKGCVIEKTELMGRYTRDSSKHQKPPRA